jgi:hypothetical protein
MVKRVVVDQEDNIWIATGSGVSKLNDPYAGINDLSAISCKIYPNPASETLTVEVQKPGSRIALYDITGKIQYTGILSAGLNMFDISAYPPGIYFLRITDGNSTYNTKLVVL